MRIMRVKKENDAVVGIITVVLLIGLIITIFSIIQVSYVPQWVESEEAKHMETLSTQFAQLKSILDFQSLVDTETSFTNYITLGRNEIPILEPHRSFGTLQILSNQTKVKIEDKNNNNNSFASGGIHFTSDHSVFIDQTYIIEAGCFIMVQSEIDGIKGSPQIVISANSNNISIVFINISRVNGRDYIGGLRTYPIVTEVIEITDYVAYDNITNLTLFTDYTRAWYYMFNDSLRNRLPVHVSGSKGYEIFENTDNVQVQFFDPLKEYYTVLIREVKIAVEIAWGLL